LQEVPASAEDLPSCRNAFRIASQQFAYALILKRMSIGPRSSSNTIEEKQQDTFGP
jgi:hypothetical protein